MITVQLFFAASVLVTGTATVEEAVGADCREGCHPGAARAGKELETDDASLLQLGLSSNVPEQFQALSSAPSATRLGSTGKAQTALDGAREGHASSEVAESDDGRSRTLAHAADDRAMRRLTLKLLETGLSTSSLADAGAQSLSTAFVLLLVVLGLLLLCFICLILCMSGRSKKRGDPSKSEFESQRSPLRTSQDVPPSPGIVSRSGSPQMPQQTMGSQPSSTGSVSAQTQPLSAPGMPLCGTLIIPDGHRLVCVVQNDIKRTKQFMSFHVRGAAARGGAALFRVDVNETSKDPGIMVETLDGKTQLAFLSTEELWAGSAMETPPALSIYRPISKEKPKGTFYGTVQRNQSGDFQVSRGQNCLMTISGDLKDHNIHITAAHGRYVASTWQQSPEEYQVNVQSNIDAGLVVLALLAVDKCIQ